MYNPFIAIWMSAYLNQLEWWFGKEPKSLVIKQRAITVHGNIYYVDFQKEAA